MRHAAASWDRNYVFSAIGKTAIGKQNAK